jgi:hypothetical protein
MGAGRHLSSHSCPTAGQSGTRSKVWTPERLPLNGLLDAGPDAVTLPE